MGPMGRMRSHGTLWLRGRCGVTARVMRCNIIRERQRRTPLKHVKALGKVAPAPANIISLKDMNIRNIEEKLGIEFPI